MNSQMQMTLKSLADNEFDVKLAEDSGNAKKMILEMMPKNGVVGVGGSATIRQITIVDELIRRGLKVLSTSGLPEDERNKVRKAALLSDVFLTSTNAVTLDGRLVNTDGIGGRVAAMIFGPGKVLFVIGKNKIVENLDEAFHRIKNLIAPYHARSRGYEAPCAVSGRCTECRAPGRVCRITTILEKRPRMTDTTIVMVDEDLGLSWDESWPAERIKAIKSKYDHC